MQELVPFIQENMILAIVWIGLVVAIIMNVIKTSNAAYKEITAAQTTQLMNRENGVVVDIRTKDEYKKVILLTHFTFCLQISKQITLVALKAIKQTQSLWYVKQVKPLKKVQTY